MSEQREGEEPIFPNPKDYEEYSLKINWYYCFLGI